MDFYKEIYNKTTKIANCILGDYQMALLNS